MSSSCSDDFQLPTSMKPDKTPCLICGEDGDGLHFGAEACRACAAFFSRSVMKGTKLVCRADGECQIRAGVRCICRACRFEKCIQIGMNPAGVQQRCPKLLKQSLKRKIEQPSSSTSSFPNKIGLETMPILEKMRQSYSKMDSGRTIIHRRKDENLFVPKTPRSVTYKESALIIEKEVSMIVDWVTCCFDEFASLPPYQKQVLFTNFYMNFTVLQAAYLCHINNRDDAIIVVSGDYIDMKNLQEFYRDETPQTISSEEAVKLFRQTFEIFRKSLILPMMEERIDAYEFFALCTCILWDFGLDGQSDECIRIGKNVKEKMLKELSFYMRKTKKIEDPSIRIATLVTLLPALNRSVRKFQQDVEISNVFNIYAVPDQFYNIINCKFV